jgi:hypothetical protein
MKKVTAPLLRSKSAILFVLVAAGISMAVPACKKDDDTKSAPALSETEVSAVVAQSLSANSGGILSQTNSSIDITNRIAAPRQGAKTTSEYCGTSLNDSINISSDVFTYAMKWSYLLTCTTEKEPQSLAVSFAGRVKLQTEKLTLNDSSVVKFKLTGLESDSTLLVFNQTFNRIGSMKVVSDSSSVTYATLLSYIAADVKVEKATRRIVSGTAAINVSGVSTTGKSFSYSGTVTYTGDNKATFAIKGGSSFTIDATLPRD